MGYKHIQLPAGGEKIAYDDEGQLQVPARPIVPFIEGDGIGVDITPVMRKVTDAAVEQAYGGARELQWMEIYAGEKAHQLYGEDTWLPDETFAALREFHVGIKGPLATPVGGGIRSLNVALRQQLDLYVCCRPVRWFEGVPSPLRTPEQVDMVVFRENSEDIYAGIEWPAGSTEAEQVISFLKSQMGVTQIRFEEQCGIGIKPVSEAGTKRLVRRALQYCIDNHRRSVTLVHKGNIMKYTEGAFRNWGYEVAREEFGAEELDSTGVLQFQHPVTGSAIEVKDVIADAMLQQVLLKPADYDVIATLNLNGDYISDALAAEVGGIGIAPGANISDRVALFEATHGTAPKYAGMDHANPGSLLLSAAMMLEHLGWHEASKRLHRALGTAIRNKQVTADFARLLPGTDALSTSAFGEAVIAALEEG